MRLPRLSQEPFVSVSAVNHGFCVSFLLVPPTGQFASSAFRDPCREPAVPCPAPPATPTAALATPAVPAMPRRRRRRQASGSGQGRGTVARRLLRPDLLLPRPCHRPHPRCPSRSLPTSCCARPWQQCRRRRGRLSRATPTAARSPWRSPQCAAPLAPGGKPPPAGAAAPVGATSKAPVGQHATGSAAEVGRPRHCADALRARRLLVLNGWLHQVAGKMTKTRTRRFWGRRSSKCCAQQAPPPAVACLGTQAIKMIDTPCFNSTAISTPRLEIDRVTIAKSGRYCSARPVTPRVWVPTTLL